MTMVTITVDTRDLTAALAALDLMSEQLGSQIAFGNQIYVDLGERTEEPEDIFPSAVSETLAQASDQIDQVRNRLLGALQEGLALEDDLAAQIEKRFGPDFSVIEAIKILAAEQLEASRKQ